MIGPQNKPGLASDRHIDLENPIGIPRFRSVDIPKRGRVVARCRASTAAAKSAGAHTSRWRYVQESARKDPNPNPARRYSFEISHDLPAPCSQHRRNAVVAKFRVAGIGRLIQCHSVSR